MATTITTRIEIDAPPSAVWSVLIERARYPEWNPFVRRWGGELRVGNRMSVDLRPPGGRVYTFRPVLVAFEDGREIRWLGKLGPGGLFNGEHSLRVEPLAEDRTRFVQSERFTGILVPLLRGAIAGASAGFEQMNQALKRRVENRSEKVGRSTGSPDAFPVPPATKSISST
jgi:hypothetical protein